MSVVPRRESLAERAQRGFPGAVANFHTSGMRWNARMQWKSDWNTACRNLTDWWNRTGPALCLIAPREQISPPLPDPPNVSSMGFEQRWCDPAVRVAYAENEMARHAYLAEAFPYLDTQIGPGSLGAFLGARPQFDALTVWYEPFIDNPNSFEGPLRLDLDNPFLLTHLHLVSSGLTASAGRYLVGVPDLVENLDTLAALRGTQETLGDLLDRPAWVHARLEEITEAWLDCFDLFYSRVKDGLTGNAFAAYRIWGPGRTAKLQCDISCMISRDMFRQFALPYLRRQCEALEYSMYHLDGEDALQHLDDLLSIDSLDAIEWTPRGGYINLHDSPTGGSPHWYDLYRRILRAGKAVQTIQVRPEEVIPLLDAVGPAGLFITCWADNMDQAERLMQRVEAYRSNPVSAPKT